VSRVSIVKCGITTRQGGRSGKEELELIGGLDRFVKKGQKVLLKANLTPYAPEAAITTHPAVLEAMVKCSGSSVQRS